MPEGTLKGHQTPSLNPNRVASPQAWGQTDPRPSSLWAQSGHFRTSFPDASAHTSTADLWLQGHLPAFHMEARIPLGRCHLGKPEVVRDGDEAMVMRTVLGAQ